MSRKNHSPAPLPARLSRPPAVQAALAFGVPIAAAVLVGELSGAFAEGVNRAPILGAIGLASWFVALALYGLTALGLKGGRPLFAGIGFATLGWVVFLVWRAFLIPVNPEIAGSTRAFVYYVLFEAFALQLWTFGLLFRVIAGWRGPLTAAVASGVVFGATAVLLFQNVYLATLITLIYYTTWGVFYGMIRLRTGSILGMVIIQGLQSFTAWVALGSMPPDTPAAQLQWVYGLSALLLAIFIWRLQPKTADDYRL